jgi:deazaflavin-dependent oxidoreductase (nitroreductase family)
MPGFIRRTLPLAAVVVLLLVFTRLFCGLDADRRCGLLIKFDKRFLNPLALRSAVHRRTYYAVLHHVGRRTGIAYDTPVVVKLTSRGLLIPLPYGSNTDWCRNVLIAGGCTVTFRGEQLRLSSPEVIPADIAEVLVPRINAILWRRVGITRYLLLQLTERVGLSTVTVAAQAA